jgi:hypothetical protein
MRKKLKKTRNQIILCVLALIFVSFSFLDAYYIVFAEDNNHKEIGIWFVTDYNWGGWSDIPYADDEADAFYNTLYAGGATKSMRHGDNNANETHWEKSSVGGHDYNYVETIDIAWFTGHGEYYRFIVNTDTDGDDTYIRIVRSSETAWGDDDLEWVFLHACYCLCKDYMSNWNNTFHKIHGICGFHTIAGAFYGGDTGEAVAEYLLEPGYSVGEAWEQGTKDSQTSTKQAAIYTAVIRPEGEEELNYYDEPFGVDWGDYGEGYIVLVRKQYKKWGC